jgi:hypothetical protein
MAMLNSQRLDLVKSTGFKDAQATERWMELAELQPDVLTMKYHEYKRQKL